MNRIASHLVGMGAYGLDLGTFSPFLYAFREREKILDLFEEACGARLTYSYLTPGGATADLPRGWLHKCSAFLDQFWPLIQRVPHAADDQRDLRQADGRHRRALARDGDQLRPQRPGAARQRRRPRPAPRRRRTLHVDVRRLRVRGDLSRRNGHYPNDHDYPAGAARSGARRLLAPVLRADARSGAKSIDLVPAGDRPLQHGRPAATASRSS